MARYKVAMIGVSSPEVLSEVRTCMPEGFDLVAMEFEGKQEKLRVASGADFFLVGPSSLAATEIEVAPGLKLIQKWGSGVDNVDLKAAAARGIPVAVTAGGNSEAVAELTVALMLAVYRRLPYMDYKMRQGQWVAPEMRSVSYQISGKVVGLVGLGYIGKEVAKRIRAFNTRVIYFKRSGPDPEVDSSSGVAYRPLDELLAESDIISLHTPLLPETKNLLDRRAFSLMKPSAIVINTARGACIDETALVDALREGRIRGAGLDTFMKEPTMAGNPLFDMNNVVVTPHVGGQVMDNVATMASHCFDNMLRVLRGEPLPAADVVVPVA